MIPLDVAPRICKPRCSNPKTVLPMALHIDTTQPFRRPSERIALVEAILSAAPEDEKDWLEWKSVLDLADADGRFGVARHVLGLANRMPEAAAANAEGFGYVVVGAEPGKVHGVTPMDPADLESGLAPYLGPTGPLWDPMYVAVQGLHVLVLQVDPPREGDRIFPLHKEHLKFLNGCIFVRRLGKTARANGAEMEALQRRLLAAGRVEMSVENRGESALRPMRLDQGAVDDWLDRAASHDRARPPAKANQLGYLGLSSTLAGDRRSVSEYKGEVASYLESLKRRATSLAIGSALHAGLNRVTLLAANSTDRNFSDVEIRLTVPPGVRCVAEYDVNKMRRPPKPPAAWGTATWLPPMDTSYLEDIVPAGYVESLEIEASGDGQTVLFRGLHLRPKAEVALDWFGAVFRDPSGPPTSISLTWTATATDANGQQHGEIVLPVVAEEVDLGHWLGRVTPWRK